VPTVRRLHSNTGHNSLLLGPSTGSSGISGVPGINIPVDITPHQVYRTSGGSDHTSNPGAHVPPSTGIGADAVDPAAIASRLIDLSLRRGSRDNMSAMVSFQSFVLLTIIYVDLQTIVVNR
jgi:hypothetical protein